MKRNKLFLILIQLLDILVCCFAFYHMLEISGESLNRVLNPRSFPWLLPLILATLHFAFILFGMYEFDRRTLFANNSFWVFPAMLCTGLFTGTTLYFLKEPLSRVFIFSFYLYCSTLLFVVREGFSRLYQFLRAQGNSEGNLVIIGTSAQAQKFCRFLEGNPQFRQVIIGFVSYKAVEDRCLIDGKPVLGDLQQLDSIFKKFRVDEAVLCKDPAVEVDVSQFLAMCEEQGVTARVLADFSSFLMAQGELVDFHGVPFISFPRTKTPTTGLALKRTFDLAGAGLGLVITSPLFLAVALLVKMRGESSVFERTEVIGENRQTFCRYRFNVPVPAVGLAMRWVRFCHLDALPQLWNVFVGQMSFVGPHCVTVDRPAANEAVQARRHQMKPGVFNLWKTQSETARSFLDDDQKDLYYIENWSLALDFQVFLQWFNSRN